MINKTSFIKFIDEILIEKNHKWLTFISVIVFLFFTTNHQFAYLNMGYDYFLQSISSISFVNGHGFSTPIINPNNVSNINYETNGLWPIGYSLIAVPFLLLTNNDAILTYRILFIISTSFMLLVSYRLMLLLKKEIDHRYFFIAILFWAVIYFPFKNIGVSDILSLSFFLLALIYFIKIINLYKEDKVKTIHLISLGIISFLPAFFRFAYYPICVVIPGTMFFLFYHQKTLFKYSIITGITTAICILGQIIFMRVYFSGGSNVGDVIPEKTQLFYFSNLWAYDAIFLNAFVDDAIISRLLGSGLSSNHLSSLFFSLSLIISIIIIGGLLILIKKKIKDKYDKLSPIYLIVLLGFISSIITILFLSFISIWYPSFALTGEQGIRTWVMFSRYHALPMYFFQLFLLMFLFANKTLTIKHLKKISGALLLLSMMINGYYWLIHEYKFQTYKPTDELADAKKVYDYLKDRKKENTTLIYVSTKRKTENEFIENNFSGMMALKSINTANYYALPNGIQEKKDIEYIVAISKGDTIINNNIKQLSKSEKIDTLFYSSSLNKNILHISAK